MAYNCGPGRHLPEASNIPFNIVCIKPLPISEGAFSEAFGNKGTAVRVNEIAKSLEKIKEDNEMPNVFRSIQE